MKTVKLILDTRRQLSDGTFPVKISVYVKNVIRFSLTTNISVKEDNWNITEIVGHPQKNSWNASLKYKLNRIDDKLIALEVTGQLNTLTPDEVKQQLLEAANVTPKNRDDKNLTVAEAHRTNPRYVHYAQNRSSKPYKLNS